VKLLEFLWSETSVEHGIFMCWRFSVGWNLHHSRTVKTVGIAISWSKDRWLLTLGPVTFIWLW
jgi:hypothetical protein